MMRSVMRIGTLAILAVLAVGFSAPAPSEAQQAGASDDDPLRTAARDRYLRGRELLGQGNALDALQEFGASYQLFPHWATAYGMAMCQDALDRLPEALRLYEQVLRDGGDDVAASERTLIGDRIAEIRREIGATVETPRTGVLRVAGTPEGAEVLVDGQTAGRLPLQAELSPGPHRVEARLDGYVAQTRWIEVPEGGEIGAEFALERGDVVVPPSGDGVLVVGSDPPGAALFVDGDRVGTTPSDPLRFPPGVHEVRIEADDGRVWSDAVELASERTVRVDVRLGGASDGLHPAWFWTTAAVAGALAIGGTATGSYVLSLRDEYDGASPDRRDEIRSTGDPLRVVTDALLGSALGFAAGATTLFFFTDFDGGEAEADVSILPLDTAGVATGGVPIVVW